MLNYSLLIRLKTFDEDKKRKETVYEVQYGKESYLCYVLWKSISIEDNVWYSLDKHGYIQRKDLHIPEVILKDLEKKMMLDTNNRKEMDYENQSKCTQ